MHEEFKKDQIISWAHQWGMDQLTVLFDPSVNLTAIVALHSLHKGPAIGGCRCLPYANVNVAMEDVLRLTHMMAYKSALLQLPHAGGKAVLLAPQGGFRSRAERSAYFEALGKQLNRLHGTYLTAVDSGTCPQDMDAIARHTDFVLCQTAQGGEQTAHYTAKGVFNGIHAAVQYRLKRESLQGCRVAIQGVGSVGLLLARLLIDAGAQLFIADHSEAALCACRDQLPAESITVVPTQRIHTVPCEVFAPCALSGTLTPSRVSQLQTPIVAGAANAQLAHESVGQRLFDQGILYVPDFVINAGGLIFAAGCHGKWPEEKMQTYVASIATRLLTVFERSQRTQTPTHIVARQMAASYL